MISPSITPTDSPDNDILTVDDYVARSKALLRNEQTIGEAQESILREWFNSSSGEADLVALRQAFSKTVSDYDDLLAAWMELSYEWIEASGCSAVEVHRIFDDLEEFYSTRSPAFEQHMLLSLTDVSWTDIGLSIRPAHAAILKHMPYALYLRTFHWQYLREEMHARAGWRCQVCNSPERLDVHHRTYERRGAELPEDLIVLCRKCHETFHKNGRLAR